MPRRSPLTFTLLFIAGCTGGDRVLAPPGIPVDGVWAGSSAQFTLSLALRVSGPTVTGTGWFAEDGALLGHAEPYIVGAVPVRVRGVATGDSLALTLTPDDDAARTLVGYEIAPVTLRGLAREGALEVRFGVVYPTLSSAPEGGEQSAALTPVADSLASGRFTLTARPPAGGTATYDVRRMATAFPVAPLPAPAVATPQFRILTQSAAPQTSFAFAGGRPAVGRYTVVPFGGAGEQPAVGTVAALLQAGCASHCRGYTPIGTAGEMVVTRSTPHAVSGHYAFTGIGPAGDTLVIAGTFDAPCARRACP